jgi:hypothetical protein
MVYNMNNMHSPNLVLVSFVSGFLCGAICAVITTLRFWLKYTKNHYYIVKKNMSDDSL